MRRLLTNAYRAIARWLSGGPLVPLDAGLYHLPHAPVALPPGIGAVLNVSSQSDDWFLRSRCVRYGWEPGFDGVTFPGHFWLARWTSWISTCRERGVPVLVHSGKDVSPSLTVLAAVLMDQYACSAHHAEGILRKRLGLSITAPAFRAGLESFGDYLRQGRFVIAR